MDPGGWKENEHHIHVITNAQWLPPMRSILQRLSLILLGLFAALLIAEAMLQLFPLPNRFTLLRKLEGLWEPDYDLLLKLRPGLDVHVWEHPEFDFKIQTNQMGLREAELTPPAPIAAIGDSFTFGFGVDQYESWPEQLEHLSQRQVANLGWAGWNSHVYPAAIRRYAIPLDAEIWIWMFYINDLAESHSAFEFHASGAENYLEWAPEARFNLTEIRFPYNLRLLQAFAVLSNPELRYLPGSGDGEFEGLELSMRYSAYPWEMTDPTDPAVTTGWNLTEEALREAQTMASEHDASLVVVFAPSREHVYWHYLESAMPGFNIHQLDDVESRLSMFCDANQIRYLNLLPAFRAQAEEGRMLYFPSDGHWNAAGHASAAEEIYRFLVEEKLISRH